MTKLHFREDTISFLFLFQWSKASVSIIRAGTILVYKEQYSTILNEEIA